METIKAIHARRTIRDFQDKEIPVEILETLLSAGLKAPSNNHMREWEFVLLQDRQKRIQLLDQLLHPVGEKGALGIIDRWGLKDEDQRAMYLDAIPKQYAMLAQAACLILPCYNQSSPLLRPKSLSDLNAFASIWMCIENILIAAADQGIMGVVRIPMEDEREKLKEFLGMPANYEIPCFLALGYPAADSRSAKQVKINLQEKMHLDQW